MVSQREGILYCTQVNWPFASWMMLALRSVSLRLGLAYRAPAAAAPFTLAMASSAAAVSSSTMIHPLTPSPLLAHTLAINGTPAAVTSTLSAAQTIAALACVPFREWAEAMDPALTVRSVHFTDIDMFGPRVGFVKFTVDATFHGRRIPGIVFMRGGAVAVLPILRSGEERWVLCIRQPRLAVPSSSFLEIPAGMLDASGAFAGVAAKEMEEETSLVMSESELIDMTALAFSSDGSAGVGGATKLRGMYPSVGACDEFLRLMYYSKVVTQDELDALRGKATGCIEEGEVITVELIRYEELWRHAPDAKTLCSLFLYEKLVAAGLLKP